MLEKHFAARRERIWNILYEVGDNMKNLRRIVLLTAAIVLAAGLSAITAWADTAAAEAKVIKEGNNIYANGVPILIKKDSDNKAYVYDQAGAEKLLPDVVSGSTAIYGGGKNVPVSGNTSIVVENVQTGTIYGGGYSDGSGSADVSGDSTVLIKGTVNAPTVYGGGRADAAKGNASADVGGTAAAKVVANPTSSGNHGSIYGGGYASTNGTYSASATAGASYAQTRGRTYVLRGGGTAYAKEAGKAQSDIRGKITIQLDAVDIREVYCGGYASGANASAKAGSVEAIGDGNEMMIFRAGGDADKGRADVDGAIHIELKKFSNLYGYTCGGGSARNGGSANAGSVNMTIKDCITPVEEQFKDYWVCASFCGGGDAEAGSQADILGKVTMNFEGNTLGGSILGGGEASGDGSAAIGSSEIRLTKCTGYYVDELNLTACPTVAAGGETDGVSPAESVIAISDSWVEEVWGGHIKEDQPSPINGAAALKVSGDQTQIREAGLFDTIELDQALDLENFVPKKAGTPTKLKAANLKTGDSLISCGSTEAEAGWFSLQGYKLNFEKGEHQSTWKIGDKIAVETPQINTESKPGAPTVAVKEDDAQKLLTEEDKQELANGSTIHFLVRVDKVEQPAQAVLQEVKQQLGNTGKKVGTYLDINLVKVKDGTESSISELSKPIDMTIAIPEELLPQSGEKRNFSIIHVHERDGQLITTELPDRDDDDKTITIRIDGLSTFALAYSDHKTGAEETSVNSGSTSGKHVNSAAEAASQPDRSAATGDDFTFWPLFLLVAVSGAAALLICRPLRKRR